MDVDSSAWIVVHSMRAAFQVAPPTRSSKGRTAKQALPYWWKPSGQADAGGSVEGASDESETKYHTLFVLQGYKSKI